jgi:hypothetical protein
MTTTAQKSRREAILHWGKVIVFEWIAPPLAFIRERVGLILDTVIRPLIFLAIVILLFSAVMLFAATWHYIKLLDVTPTSDGYLITISKWFLSFFVSEPDFSKKDQTTTQLAVIIGSLGAFATAFFSIATVPSTWMVQRKLKSSATIQTTRIYNQGSDDIKVMLREFSKGHKVTIFGGDFSWLTDSPHRIEIMKFLERGNVNFVSYRSLQEIKTKNERLFETISNRITIEKSLDGLKASLIFDSTGKNLLSYLYATKSERDHNLVCKISAKNPDGRHLLAHLLSFADRYPLTQAARVILVCGKSQTGKTEFCELVSSLGYSTIKASQLVRDLYLEDHKRVPGPEELLDYGTQFINPKLPHGRRLFDRILVLIENSSQPLVVDGLRVPWIFNQIISIYGHKARYIHFSVNEETRKSRLEKHYGSKFTAILAEKLNTLDERAEFFRNLYIPEYDGEGGLTAYGALVPRRFPNLIQDHANVKDEK